MTESVDSLGAMNTNTWMMMVIIKVMTYISACSSSGKREGDCACRSELSPDRWMHLGLVLSYEPPNKARFKVTEACSVPAYFFSGTTLYKLGSDPNSECINPIGIRHPMPLMFRKSIEEVFDGAK